MVPGAVGISHYRLDNDMVLDHSALPQWNKRLCVSYCMCSPGAKILEATEISKSKDWENLRLQHRQELGKNFTEIKNKRLTLVTIFQEGYQEEFIILPAV